MPIKNLAFNKAVQGTARAAVPLWKALLEESTAFSADPYKMP